MYLSLKSSTTPPKIPSARVTSVDEVALRLAEGMLLKVQTPSAVKSDPLAPLFQMFCCSARYRTVAATDRSPMPPRACLVSEAFIPSVRLKLRERLPPCATPEMFRNPLGRKF